MTDTVTLYRADDGWRWRYEASGRVLADSGQGYSRRIDAVKGACRVVGCSRMQTQDAIDALRCGRLHRHGRGHGHTVFIRIEATR